MYFFVVNLFSVFSLDVTRRISGAMNVFVVFYFILFYLQFFETLLIFLFNLRFRIMCKIGDRTRHEKTYNFCIIYSLFIYLCFMVNFSGNMRWFFFFFNVKT